MPGSAHATSLPPLARYNDVLPRDYWEPAARLSKLADLGVDEAVLFPNQSGRPRGFAHQSVGAAAPG